MSWRARTWTRIAAAFMGLVALALVAGSGMAQEFEYTLDELEDKIDKSPKVKLLLARLDEKRRQESVWNHIHVSASLNPIRTADEFTDSIRAGISVSIPFEVFQPKSYQAELMELRILRQDLKREVRKLWFDRQRRALEIRQLELERAGARLAEEKLKVKLAVRDASADELEAARLAISRIETQVLEKQLDIRDLEDQLLALVGEL
jgi:hypothetical protein